MTKRGESIEGPGCESPLLGMIIDRSSFDEEEESQVEEMRFSITRRKDGKVRRKLNWKPAAFRSKRNKASDISVMSERSNRTSQSFHTFHSTETPVQSNKSKKPKLPISRPNYTDTFTGMMTINNDGRFNRRKRSQKSHSTTSSAESFDFESIDGDTSAENEKSRAKIYPQESSSDTPVLLQGKGIKDLSNLQLSIPTVSPSESLSASSASSSSSQNNQISEHSSDVSDLSASAQDLRSKSTDEKMLPIIEEEDQQNRTFPKNGADAAAGLGRQAKKGLTPKGRPPLTKRTISLTSGMQSLDIDSLRSPSEVLSNTSSKAMTDVSQFSGHFAQTSLPLKTPNKRYNRPVELTTIYHEDDNDSADSDLDVAAKSVSANEVLVVTNDGEVVPGSVVHHGSWLVSTSSSSSSSSSSLPTSVPVNPSKIGAMTNKKRSRKSGPVDVDDGAFVEAERNLKAIHEMAAEHLAHGEFEEALEVFQEVLRGQKERYGKDHYRIGTALHNIGIVHLKSGNYPAAVETCKEAVRIRKNTLVPNHPDVAVSLALLGVAHLECREFRESLVAFRSALHIRREFLGPRHPKVGKILNNIGCALCELNELSGAKLAFDEALEIQRETLRTFPVSADEVESMGNSHQLLLSIASTLSNIGSIKLRLEEYEEANVALEEALLIQQSVLGDHHPTVSTTLENIENVERMIQERSLVSMEFCKWPDSSLTRLEKDTGSVKRSSSPGSDRFGVLLKARWNNQNRWYHKLGDFIPDTGCGPVREGRCGDNNCDDESFQEDYEYNGANCGREQRQGYEI